MVECLFGGGFVVWQGAALTILNSEIEENVARYGGGIQVCVDAGRARVEADAQPLQLDGYASVSATSGSWSR